MQRRGGFVARHVLLVALLAAGLTACAVKVETPDWDALGDPGATQDPGMPQDPGVPDDPGPGGDPGDRPDTVVPIDPGGTEDPGAGQDPGLIEEAFEDIPYAPCSLVFNPSCSPEPCDDGNPDTANDRCQAGAGDPPDCRCAGSAIPMDPCLGLAQNQCVAIACDDGDARTDNDGCRWGTDADGLEACVCGGDPVLTAACLSVFNPSCESKGCLLGGLVPGRCGKGGVLDTCTCVPLDPCGRVANPNCMPEQCIASSTSLGMCTSDLVACGCKESTLDPCGTKANPVCASLVCVREGRLGFGQCTPTQLGGCECAAIDVKHPCGSAANPECKAADCELASGGKGACRQTLTGMCLCDKP